MTGRRLVDLGHLAYVGGEGQHGLVMRAYAAPRGDGRWVVHHAGPTPPETVADRDTALGRLRQIGGLPVEVWP